MYVRNHVTESAAVRSVYENIALPVDQCKS